ncbi:hypothetical protein ACWF2L_36575 [Streptomyces anulatus]
MCSRPRQSATCRDRGLVPPGFAGVILALTVTTLAYGDTEAVALTAAESKDPARDIPRQCASRLVQMRPAALRMQQRRLREGDASAEPVLSMPAGAHAMGYGSVSPLARDSEQAQVALSTRRSVAARRLPAAGACPGRHFPCALEPN